MNRNEYDTFCTETPEAAPVISINHLLNRTPRTLIYGYTFERHDFHVYIGTDAAIHALVYTEVSADPETGNARFLVFSHAGPGGRELESNHEFLPSKRAYPEACDLEFCRLLRSHGLQPSFTTFTEREVVDGQSGQLYKGETFRPGQMLAGKMLNDVFHGHPRFTELAKGDRTLAARLLMEAAQDLGIPADTYGGSAVVAEYGADAVVKKATEYLESIQVEDVSSLGFASDLIAEVFGYGNYIVPSQRDLIHGRVSFSVDPEKTPFKKNPKVTRYTSAGYEGERAIIGDYEGMPFLAMHMSENNVLLEFQQFGNRERRIAQWTRMFGLTPVGKKKAAKDAAAA